MNRFTHCSKPFNVLMRRSLRLTLLLLITSCTTTSKDMSFADDAEVINANVKVKPSYLASDSTVMPIYESDGNATLAEDKTTKELAKSQAMTNLQVLPRTDTSMRNAASMTDVFSDQPSLTISVDNMPLHDFLHYTFGELLNINYIIGDTIKKDSQGITLNIREKISPRRLMQLTSELLAQRKIEIKYDNEIYFIRQAEQRKKGKDVITAVGRELVDVPETEQDILQIVPMKYGVKVSIERALRQLVGIQISQDAAQSALFLEGKRDDILRALEFIHLLDAPSNRGRYIGLIPLTYIESEQFTEQVTLLLSNEGVPIATNTPRNENLVMVPIEQVGAVAVFAADRELLSRVRYWAKIIDKPQQSVTRHYYIYRPNFARATDLGESLTPLLGGINDSLNSADSAKNKTGSAPSSKRNSGVSNDEITLVVDNRSNALIFHCTGTEYQTLLPLITQLDVLPRQVMLDITIAEVTLTDEFKYGVDWALTNGALGEGLSSGKSFTRGVDGALAFALQGGNGFINANLLSTNKLTNVLSNPTLLVRDGATANIIVGDEISVTTSTTSDAVGGGTADVIKQEYRKTGLDVTVTPSVNAKGIVIMEISQKISNSVPNSGSEGGNPDIAERSIKTEVVAQSGQTIILAGLIAENKNDQSNETPWLADVPILGYLFKSGGDSKARTELVMMITPKVIDRTDQWEELTAGFKDNLRNLQLDNKVTWDKTNHNSTEQTPLLLEPTNIDTEATIQR